MRPPIVFILTAIFALLQVTLLDYFRIFGAKPDLLLIAVFFGCLFLKQKKAFALGIFSGLFKDIFSLNAFGLNTVLFPAGVILIAKLMRRVSIEDNLSRILLIFVVALLNNIISGLVLVYTGVYIPLGIFLRIIIFSSMYTAAVFYLTIRLTVK
ncbi:MAG: rod shape-determining protein MreD [Candidatus Omnitrophica bacterium]|nr:rod shape-determining protein MreD [Candidatus Omnitrophota bacterium]